MNTYQTTGTGAIKALQAVGEAKISKIAEFVVLRLPERSLVLRGAFNAAGGVYQWNFLTINPLGQWRTRDDWILHHDERQLLVEWSDEASMIFMQGPAEGPDRFIYRGAKLTPVSEDLFSVPAWTAFEGSSSPTLEPVSTSEPAPPPPIQSGLGGDFGGGGASASFDEPPAPPAAPPPESAPSTYDSGSSYSSDSGSSSSDSGSSSSSD